MVTAPFDAEETSFAYLSKTPPMRFGFLGLKAARRAAILVGELDRAGIEGPGQGQVGVVPGDAAIAIRRVEIGDLVGHLGLRDQGAEAMPISTISAAISNMSTDPGPLQLATAQNTPPLATGGEFEPGAEEMLASQGGTLYPASEFD